MALGRIIDRLRRSNREQRKLLFSLGAHVGTRIPGAVGVLWFLPLLYADLGTADYSKLLTALALGGAAGFLSGGFNYAGRRLIGEAYSVLDRKDEADSFASLVVANLLAQCVMLAAIGVYCWVQGASIAVFITAIIPVCTQFIAQFDDVRAAYNELYISSTILIILQTVIYAIGIMVPATRQNMVLGALVMMGPYMLSSLLSLVLLLRSRPNLLRGRPRRVRLVMQQGTMFAMADGLIMAALSLSVVWFHTVASAEASAYYATIGTTVPDFSGTDCHGAVSAIELHPAALERQDQRPAAALHQVCIVARPGVWRRRHNRLAHLIPAVCCVAAPFDGAG